MEEVKELYFSTVLSKSGQGGKKGLGKNIIEEVKYQNFVTS